MYLVLKYTQHSEEERSIMKQPFQALAPHWSATPIARVLGPMQQFISREASSGIILLSMAIIALVLANSPLAGSYQALLDTHIGIALGPFVLEETVLHWVNDGLMAIFFFLVGLEIKREVVVGELADPRAAALPIVAALGGVLAPAAIYIALNVGQPGARGSARARAAGACRWPPISHLRSAAWRCLASVSHLRSRCFSPPSRSSMT
jgi:hypothetical protein